ncbi:MAG TPA: chemotaxis protein CheW [Gemmatimonadaceae bacterium]|nr:chemotaxis protein CheW [Gemmatimonadaceae bacterium]
MSDADPRQVVVFALGEDLFAADVRLVERVLRHRAPVPVPQLPPWVAGVVEHAGRSLPVVDLRQRFELPAAPPGVERRVLVAGSGAEAVGLVVDRVLEVAPVGGALDPAPALFRGLAREYLHGILRRDDGLVIVLDLARLLTATERIALQQALVDV